MNNKSKWLFGPRKTANKPTTEMCSYELMLNNCYVDNQSAMYRDFNESRDIRSLIRDIAKSMRVYLTDDPELLDTALFEYLEDELDTTCGVLGLLYSLMWSKAELYEKLNRYEDAEERGEIGRVPRWIPVTERLPENTADVLVFRPKMKIEIGISCRINDEWLRYGKDLHGNDVITHWMPLPKFDMGSERDEA